MKAPGSPSSPLQMTYFFSPAAARAGGPFLPRGKAGPAAAPQPARPDLLDDLLGRELFQAVPQGLETVVADVLVQVGRIDLAAILGGHVPLRAKERADRPIADVDRAVGHRVGRLVAEETIDPAGRAMRHPPPKALGLVLRKHDGPGIFGLHAGEELRRSAARRDQFHQRRLMAHTHAADLFHHRRRPPWRPGCGRWCHALSRCPGPRSTNPGRRGSRPLGHHARPPPNRRAVPRNRPRERPRSLRRHGAS